MSGYDNLAVSLGLYHQDRPAEKRKVANGGPPQDDEWLAREMKITFGADELSTFFSGFAGLDASQLYEAILDAA
jgi:hypothetical protein